MNFRKHGFVLIQLGGAHDCMNVVRQFSELKTSNFVLGKIIVIIYYRYKISIAGNFKHLDSGVRCCES